MRERKRDVRAHSGPVATHRWDPRLPVDRAHGWSTGPRHRKRTSDARSPRASTLGIGTRYLGDNLAAFIGATGATVATAYVIARVIWG